MTNLQKTHIAKDGIRKLCSASKRKCRYGGEEAHLWVEASTLGKIITTPDDVFTELAKEKEDARVESQTGEEFAATETTYTILPDKFAQFEARIDAANRKLERQGLTERFEFTVEDVIKYHEGSTFLLKKVELNYPSISEEGWTFVASTKALPINPESIKGDEERQFITHTAPGQTLGNDLPETFQCEHCGSNRERHKTYVLRHQNGDVKQVGSTCVEKFLGIRPRGIWALQFNPCEENEHEEKEDSDFNNYYGAENTVFPTKNILALALAITDGGKTYRSSAFENTENPSTSKLIKSHLTKPGFNIDSYGNNSEQYKQAEKILNELKFDDKSEYAQNMTAILTSTYVTRKQVGYVASAIVAYKRSEEKRIKAERPKASGFLGAPGDKIEKITAVVERVNTYKSSYYGAAPTQILILRTSDNQVIKWNSSSTDDKIISLKTGMTVNFNVLKVKKHDHYNGEDQTIINATAKQINTSSE